MCVVDVRCVVYEYVSFKVCDGVCVSFIKVCVWCS